MPDDDIVELKCRFCGGRLNPETRDLPNRKIAFRFYQCESCNMPNAVGAFPSAAQQMRMASLHRFSHAYGRIRQCRN